MNIWILKVDQDAPLYFTKFHLLQSYIHDNLDSYIKYFSVELIYTSN